METEGADIVLVIGGTGPGACDHAAAAQSVARQYGLGFIPAKDEHYDFAIPKARWDSPAVQRFRAAFADPSVRKALAAFGFQL